MDDMFYAPRIHKEQLMSKQGPNVDTTPHVLNVQSELHLARPTPRLVIKQSYIPLKYFLVHTPDPPRYPPIGTWLDFPCKSRIDQNKWKSKRFSLENHSSPAPNGSLLTHDHALHSGQVTLLGSNFKVAVDNAIRIFC